MSEPGSSNDAQHSDFETQRERYQTVGMIAGPSLFVLMLLMDAPAGMSEVAWRCAAMGVWLAFWWATEAVPVPVTSLLPLVLAPLLGIHDIGAAAKPYASKIIFLLMGGFIIAVALERWNLHRRVALAVLLRAGDHPGAIIGGFMIGTAVISMWVSNTATTIMMIPIALSVASEITEDTGKGSTGHKFTLVLLLAIAYAASIGGLGTLIGTPPNAMVAGYMGENFGIDISFSTWLIFGVPVVICLVPAAWVVLTRMAFRFNYDDVKGATGIVRGHYEALGSISTPEKRTATMIGVVAILWMTRPLLQKISGLESLSDAGIAIAGAIAMFLIPSGRTKGEALLTWERAERIPWGMLLLFGGGLSFAAAVTGSGLGIWIGEAMSGLVTLHMFVLIGAIVTLIIFMTELTSNTGTTATMLPVLGAIAVSASMDPMLLATPAALAASCAFMLPVATGPNAIVFGTGRVSIPEMAGAGFRLNLIAIPILTVLCYALIPVVFG